MCDQSLGFSDGAFSTYCKQECGTVTDATDIGVYAAYSTCTFKNGFGAINGATFIQSYGSQLIENDCSSDAEICNRLSAGLF